MFSICGENWICRVQNSGSEWYVTEELNKLRIKTGPYYKNMYEYLGLYYYEYHTIFCSGGFVST